MNTTRSILLAYAILAVAALGCDRGGAAAAAEGESAPKAAAVAKAETPEAAAKAAPQAGEKAAPRAEEKAAEMHEAHEGHDQGGCGAETAGRGPGSEAVPAGETPLGQAILHGGGDFTDAPEVTVEALLANPDEYAGKTIQLTGDVSAMCHHRRGWFALVAGDKSGQQVRVLTMPNFKVPAGSIGRTARAEGTVEVIEVPAQHAKHLMKDHKLGDPGAVKGATLKQVVLRATTADFIEVAAK